jgi:hypothetical protein
MMRSMSFDALLESSALGATTRLSCNGCGFAFVVCLLIVYV